MAMSETDRAIILFDGVCNLCNRSVDRVIRDDPAGRFRFASLQSDVGRSLAAEHGIDADQLSSMVLIEDGIAYTESTAALRIARHLNGPLRWLRVLRFLPCVLRDSGYRLIARNRYRFFGKRETCRLPTPEDQRRFL